MHTGAPVCSLSTHFPHNDTQTLDPSPPSFLRQPPFPLTHSVASPSGLRIRPLSLGGSASHAELTRGTCWVWAHRISLQDRGRMPQTEPRGLPLPWLTLPPAQAGFKMSYSKNRIYNFKLEDVFHTSSSSFSGWVPLWVKKWAATNVADLRESEELKGGARPNLLVW